MIITFYSYKGGVGRSMALANIAELLYRKGLKVLVVDWDLEAPGLERFFSSSSNETLDKPGIMDMLQNYKEQMSHDILIQKEKDLPFEKLNKFIIDIYSKSKSGKLYMLTSGRKSKQYFANYANAVLTFDWEDFYLNWGGELYIEWLRQQFEEIADITLIDSRTGVTEMGGICTYQLADIIVMFCAMNRQNMEGTEIMAQNFSSNKLIEYRGDRKLQIIIVPARVEDRAEKEILKKYQKDFIFRFDKYMSDTMKSNINSFWDLKIPHVPYYAFNEIIAINNDEKENSDDIVIKFDKLALIMALISPRDSRLYQKYHQKKFLNVPSLPTHFLPRPAILKDIREMLLSKEINNNSPISPTIIAVLGMAGIGKTTIAAALAHDERVLEAFNDGVIWITLGQEPYLLDKQRQILDYFYENPNTIADIENGRSYIYNLTQNKSCLIILDDVWALEDIRAFNTIGSSCKILITTRNRDIAGAMGAEEYIIDSLSDNEALELLSNWSNQSLEGLPLAASEVAKLCGNLPLAIAIAGSMVRGKPDRWKNVFDRLQSVDLEMNRAKLPDYRYNNLQMAIEASIKTLDPDQRQKYIELAVFPKDVAVPENTLQALWNIDKFEVQDLMDLFSDRSLAIIEDDTLRLHDLLHDFVVKMNNDIEHVHNQLLDSYRNKCIDGWWTGPNDGYFFQYLAYHLVHSHKNNELEVLLSDFRWLDAKLNHMDIYSVISDFNLIPENKKLKMIRSSLKLSMHILSHDKSQLVSQLLGRIQDLKNFDKTYYLRQVWKSKNCPFLLLPLRATLSPPDGPLIQTLANNHHIVKAVSVTPDGSFIIGALSNGDIKIWDLELGKECMILSGHNESANTIAITPDGKLALSASWDRTIKIWDLQTGEELKTLSGHDDNIKAVAITPDGKQVVSASDDSTLKLWDIESGKILFTLIGHHNSVNSVLITPDGKKIVSASSDSTLRIWDLETGLEIGKLEDKNSVDAVAITSDGKIIISGSSDSTLKIWDFEKGKEIRTLKGHTGAITDIAIISDRKRIISGSLDSTLKVWDLNSGQELESFSGHGSPVYGVAITPDGRRALSASWDRTIKIWNLDWCKKSEDLRGHNGRINSIAVTSDGKIAVSASNGFTLKVWDIERSEEIRTLKGHTRPINAVAITPDGKKLVSGSSDRTLKIWDLKTGKLIRTIKGNAFESVAVTPDGKKAITGSWCSTICVWDIETGKKIRSFENGDKVNCIAVAPDGKTLISGDLDGRIRVWDLETSKNLNILSGHKGIIQGITVASDGKLVVSASWDHTIKIWDLQTGKELKTLLGHDDLVHAVAVNSNCWIMVSTSEDCTVKVWNLKNDSIIATFYGDSSIESCALTPNSKTIIVGEANGRVHFLRLYDLATYYETEEND